MDLPDKSQPVAQELSIGSIAFDRFKILSELGVGAKGRVYKAQDMLLDKTVALKILLSGNNEKYVLRFQTEARTISKMNHPNISMIYDFGIFGNTPFLSMEYIEGETLESLLERINTIPVAEFCVIFLQICDALDHAHAAGIVHRDIKPANIVISGSTAGDCLVKVLDFGVAKKLEIIEEDNSSLTPTGNIVGSPNYMSPEQCDGKGVLTTASDNYSLGCVMWECLAGAPPFEGASVMETLSMHVNQQPRKLVDVVDVPERLSDLIDGLLSKDPLKRPDLATVVIPELEELRTECAQLFEEDDTTPGGDDQPLQSAKPTRLKTLVAALTLVLLSVGVVFSVHSILGHADTDTEKSKSYSRAIEKTIDVDIKGPGGVNIDNKIREIGRASNELNMMAELYSVENLKKCRGLSGLLQLNLDDSKFSDQQIRLLADIPNLEVLKLNRTDVKTLSGMERVKHLREIELNDTKIQNGALKNLVNLKHLSEIHLSHDEIGDEGLEILSTVPDLTDLDVSHTQIKLISSKQIQGFAKLKNLHLEGNDLHEAGLRSLLHAPSLELVHLRKTELFNNLKLRSDFPNIRFDGEASVLEILEEQFREASAVGEDKFALTTLRQMIDLAKNRFGSESAQVARYYPRLAEICVRLDRTDEAKRTIAKLLSFYKRTNNSEYLFGALNAQALSAAKSGDLKSAISLRERLVRACEQKFEANSEQTITQLINLGNTYCGAHQMAKGLECYKLAVERSSHLSQTELGEHSLIKCGDCYLMLSDYANATRCYEQAIKILEPKQLTHREAIELFGVYANYADIKLGSGKRGKALEINDKMLKLAKTGLIPVRYQIRLHFQRSQIYAALGKVEEKNRALAESKRLQVQAGQNAN